jgi:DUF971 family protein
MLRTPVRIEPSPKNQDRLILTWNTGESYSLPYFEIRYECPCAICVDEKTGKRVLTREELDQNVRPIEVNLIGRYALQIRWSDTHTTGMYHFDRLFEICQRLGQVHTL